MTVHSFVDSVLFPCAVCTALFRRCITMIPFTNNNDDEPDDTTKLIVHSFIARSTSLILRLTSLIIIVCLISQYFLRDEDGDGDIDLDDWFDIIDLDDDQTISFLEIFVGIVIVTLFICMGHIFAVLLFVLITSIETVKKADVLFASVVNCCGNQQKKSKKSKYIMLKQKKTTNNRATCCQGERSCCKKGCCHWQGIKSTAKM